MYIEMVKNFIWEYRYLIMWLLIATITFLADINAMKSKIALTMVAAKKLAKDGNLKNGEQQVEWIINQAYQKLPARYQILSEATRKKLIGWLYSKAMDYLDDGVLNNSLVEASTPVNDVTDPRD